MNEMIAYCGLACHECDAFLATKNNDDSARADIAQRWSKQYGADIKPADINCKGCASDSEPIFNYCKVCEIRKCAIEKGIVNCACCDDYACAKLEEVFKIAPDAKKRLDELMGG